MQHGRSQTAGVVLLCLLVLFAQSVSLIHTHDRDHNDLQRHSDCEICIKFGADDEAAVIAVAVLPLRPAVGLIVDSGGQFTPLPFLIPHSRAPPLG